MEGGQKRRSLATYALVGVTFAMVLVALAEALVIARSSQRARISKAKDGVRERRPDEAPLGGNLTLGLRLIGDG